MSTKPAALAFVILAGLVGGCSKSPAAPAPIPTATLDLTGAVWTGHIRIDTCASPRGCGNFVGVHYPFTLTLSPGAPVAATLTGETPESYTVLMSGTIEADGTHVFRGGLSSNGRVEIRELRVRKDRDAVLTGTIDYTANRNTSDPRTLAARIPSATLQRDPRTPGTAGIPSLAGTWVGTGRTDACTGFSCGSVGTPGTFSITIHESAGQIAAVLDSDIWARRIVTLNGVRQPDDSVRFTGSWTPLQANRSGVFRHFTLRTDPALGLTGAFEWFETAPAGTLTRTGVILSASRHVIIHSPGVFEGLWRGSYIARSCSGDCGFVSFTNDQPFIMALTQVGGAVTGRAQVPALPLAGTASGRVATLAGEDIVDPCAWDFEGATCTQRIRALSVAVDDLGRMSGTFEYFKEGWAGLFHYRYTVVAELGDVVRSFY